MSYQWDEINELWLAGSRVSLSSDQLVDSFNTAERLLSHEWMDAQRFNNGYVQSGPYITLYVAAIGRMLGVIESVADVNELVTRLKTRDRAALSELMAAFLCLRGNPNVNLEFGINIRVGNRIKQPDFRLRVGSDTWTHVEVTAPDNSIQQKHAQSTLDSITMLLPEFLDGTVVEVLLLRGPTDKEVIQLCTEVRILIENPTRVIKLVNNLAVIALNVAQLELDVLRNYKEQLGPMLCVSRAEVGKARKNISVSIPVVDQRAMNFLRIEARQLTASEKGIVMIDMKSICAGIKKWKVLLEHRLQPKIHTRVSGICLFRYACEDTPDGEAIVPETLVIENRFARNPMPHWLCEQLITTSRVPV